MPGSAEFPMTWNDIFAKFGECAAAAVIRPAPDKVARAQSLAQHLETLPDATELMRAPA